MDVVSHKICPKCHNIYTEKRGKYSSFLICLTCLYINRTQYEHSVWCKNPKIIIVKKSYDSNTIYAYEQCSSCGLKIRGPISKKGLDMDSATIFNDELNQSLNDEIYKEYNSFQNELIEIRKNNFFAKYGEYLNSVAWKDKRDMVLKRDNYLCQACLLSKATEVHHMTYKHVFNEPLFELISVCKSCHDQITKMDSEKDKLYGGKGNSFFN